MPPSTIASSGSVTTARWMPRRVGRDRGRTANGSGANCSAKTCCSFMDASSEKVSNEMRSQIEPDRAPAGAAQIGSARLLLFKDVNRAEVDARLKYPG